MNIAIRKRIINFAQASYGLILETYFKNCKKIIDAGCGDGSFSSLDMSRITGVDVFKSELFVGDNFVKADLKKLPFKNNSFDGVFCAHVLEHMVDIIGVLKEFHRVLKPQGKLVVLVPSYWKLYVPFSKYNFFAEPTHIRPYTPFSLNNALEWGGFKVKEVCYNKFYFPFVRSFFRIINKPLAYKKFVRHLSCPFPPFELFAFAIKK